MITQDGVKEILDFDTTTGALLWRKRDASTFTSEKHCKRWNTCFAGKEAGCVKFTGYRHISLGGKFYQAHRLVWLHVYGSWPDKIDHIDGDKSNNRINNLRSVTDAENSRNKPISSANTSGCVGVSFSKQSGKWYAYIKTGGKMQSLGFYADIAAAIAARKSAEFSLGFHENHGRAA